MYCCYTPALAFCSVLHLWPAWQIIDCTDNTDELLKTTMTTVTPFVCATGYIARVLATDSDGSTRFVISRSLSFNY